jgi:hypothetical protein
MQQMAERLSGLATQFRPARTGEAGRRICERRMASEKRFQNHR